VAPCSVSPGTDCVLVSTCAKAFLARSYKTTHAMLAIESTRAAAVEQANHLQGERVERLRSVQPREADRNDRLGGQFLELDDRSTSTQGDRCFTPPSEVHRQPRDVTSWSGYKQDDLLAWVRGHRAWRRVIR